MGKSRAKKKKMKCCSGISNKLDRSKANRKFRRLTREKILDEVNIPMSMREVSDPWNFKSDGLALFCIDLPEKWLRR